MMRKRPRDEYNKRQEDKPSRGKKQHRRGSPTIAFQAEQTHNAEDEYNVKPTQNGDDIESAPS